METTDIFKALREATPLAFVSTRKGYGGGKPLDYVEWRWVWERVLDVAPYANWAVVNVEPFIDLDYGGFYVHGRLTIDGISRDGVGFAPFKKGAVDNGVKDATTDALKRACILFGVALDLYPSKGDSDNGEALPGERDMAADHVRRDQPAPSSYGDQRQELPPVGKFCFAVAKAIDITLGGLGVSNDDFWNYATGAFGVESRNDLTQPQWKKIADSLEKCQEGKYPDNVEVPHEIEALAKRIRESDTYKASYPHAEAMETSQDDDIPF